MKYNNTTIKNPLTIIAIFSGISEISGSAILPFLEENNQETFLWFLMLFPFFLVLLFFATLNWNYKVLYAPSDFNDENHFVNLLRKASASETYAKIKEEISEEEEDLMDGDVKNDNAEDNTEHDNQSTSTSENQKTVNDDFDYQSKRQKDDKIIRSINEQRIQEGLLAELLVFNKLEKEFKLPIQKDMKINVGKNSVIFDGVIKLPNQFLFIDIKFMRTKNAFNLSMWERLKSKYEKLYYSLEDSQKKSFNMMFIVTTTDDTNKVKEIVNSKLKDLPFFLETRIYNLDELRKNSNVLHK